MNYDVCSVLLPGQITVIFFEVIILRVIACNSGTQIRVRDSSATGIFFKKNNMMQHWAQKITTKF